MTPTPSPDPAAAAGEERPGGWVPELGVWVAWCDHLPAGTEVLEPDGGTFTIHKPTFTGYPHELSQVYRWPDGSTPQPPVPPQGTERPDTDAEQLRAAADWFDTFDKMGRAFFASLARSTMSDEMRAGAEALIPTFDGDEVQADLRRIADRLDALDAQPPVPPSPAPQADGEVATALRRLEDAVLLDDPNHAVAEAAEAFIRARLAAPPSAPVERPQPDGEQHG